MLVSFESSELV
jgi:ATP-dependent 26S proteasome regulatory subunit